MDVGTAIRANSPVVVTVSADDDIRTLAGILTENHIGAVPVVDGGGGIVGMISERDLVRGIASGGADIVGQTVRDLMTADVVACKATDSLADIRDMMTEGRFRHMPVIEEGELVGIITIRNIVDNMVDETGG